MTAALDCGRHGEMDLAGVDVGEVPTERLSPRTQPQRPRRRILGEKAGLDAWPTRSSPGMPDNPAKATGDRKRLTRAMNVFLIRITETVAANQR